MPDITLNQARPANSFPPPPCSLREVSLDVAEPRNTGQARAFAVEECQCPPGYKGLSCQDCDVGYTRLVVWM